MQFRIPAGEAALYAASTLTEQTTVAREGALLVFTFDDGAKQPDCISALGLLTGLIDAERLARREQPAEVAGLADLRGSVASIVRDVNTHFGLVEALGGSDASSDDTASHPTATGDAATSVSATQSSDATNEETDSEQSQEPAEQPRRRRG